MKNLHLLKTLQQNMAIGTDLVNITVDLRVSCLKLLAIKAHFDKFMLFLVRYV